MTTRTLAVVSGGLSNPSSTRLLGDRLTAAAVDALRARGEDTTVEVVELREHARDLADNLVTGFANTALQTAVDTVTGADGLIAVTPIFSASYSGLFKTFFDVLDKDALTGKPVLLGATAGTARHSSPSSTPSGRCSPTCARSLCPPPSSPRRRTGPAPVASTVPWPVASSGPPANWPTWSADAPGARAGWTRSPTRRRPSRTSSAAPAPGPDPPQAPGIGTYTCVLGAETQV
ncbi:CE1759 family FMN reductase [Blastococcus brunescens]|uniref:CE1759 family FMN reductase n=1 Tax=Blastococcus brunescens TaxID=1564165 RepID=A0ABZ1AT18_9ACTN|nr:CE1759 family FMN reductase [Blastococcus sp. BMG 8361]WRL61717.1 CE1759 family FMN reductase [Blastococcus sp. BMG 8361]